MFEKWSARNLLTLGGLAISAAMPAVAPAQSEPGAGLTFYKDILPIFQKHCMSCHHTGGTAPQSLETYQKSRPWIRTSRKTIKDGTMPPWHADPNVGNFKNMLLMTPEEIKIVEDWVEAGAEEGDKASGPAAIDYSAEWKLGTPDKVFEMSEAMAIPAEGPDLYRAFVVSPAMTEDTWIQGAEFKPGEMDVVRDMWLSAAPEATAKQADQADNGPGFTVFDRGWAEGTKDHIAVWNRGMSLLEKLPEGTGVLVPKGHVLVLVNHYITVGDPVEDKSKVAIFTAKAAPAKEMKTLAVENRQISVPEQSYDHKIAAEKALEKGIKVYSIQPHMHYLGTKLTLTATPPGGSAQQLIKIDAYNYKLQTVYTLAEPVSLPAGTKLSVEGFYENSPDNPNNPNMVIKKADYGPAPMGEVLSVILTYTEE
jgi:mono/diheme cytochrome c family protein